MNPSTKGAIGLTIVGGLIAIAKIVLQMRANKELQAAASEKEARLATLQREREERLARHAKEAEERLAERTQKENLIAQLQKASEDTLQVLKTELAAQQKTNDRAFELLDRNTRSTESLTQAVAAQTAELSRMSVALGALQSGAGCRAERRQS